MRGRCVRPANSTPTSSAAPSSIAASVLPCCTTPAMRLRIPRLPRRAIVASSPTDRFHAAPIFLVRSGRREDFPTARLFLGPHRTRATAGVWCIDFHYRTLFLVNRITLPHRTTQRSPMAWKIPASISRVRLGLSERNPVTLDFDTPRALANSALDVECLFISFWMRCCTSTTNSCFASSRACAAISNFASSSSSRLFHDQVQPGVFRAAPNLHDACLHVAALCVHL
jgi:hypothetical protein